jgi:hypothetical protein
VKGGTVGLGVGCGVGERDGDLEIVGAEEGVEVGAEVTDGADVGDPGSLTGFAEGAGVATEGAGVKPLVGLKHPG